MFSIDTNTGALAFLAAQRYTAAPADPKQRGRARKFDDTYMLYIKMAVETGNKEAMKVFFEVEAMKHYKAHVIELGIMPENFLD